ncbi:MAG: hypothetical protein VCA74_01875 [Deltaproteobacteria bacterium]
MGPPTTATVFFFVLGGSLAVLALALLSSLAGLLATSSRPRRHVLMESAWTLVPLTLVTGLLAVTWLCP